MIARVCLLVAIVGSARATFIPPSGEIAGCDYDHVVVIPDIHGDVAALRRSLWLAQRKVDPARVEDLTAFTAVAPPRSSPGAKRVVLVQLGDLVDRGPASAECVETMALVEKVLGCRIVQLYGNHELMTLLQPQERYVHPDDFERGKGRKAMWRWFQEGPGFDMVTQNFLGLAVLRSPSGGKTDTLFVHGGIDLGWFLGQPWAVTDSVNAMNEGIVRLMRSARTDERMRLYGHKHAFVWTRVFEEAGEADLCGYILKPILKHFKAARIVVGNSPQTAGRARVRCDGKVILADTVISRWMRIEDFKSVRKGTHAEDSNPTAFVITLNDGELDSIVEYHTDLRTGETETSVVLLPSVGALSQAREPQCRKPTTEDPARFPPFQLSTAERRGTLSTVTKPQRAPGKPAAAPSRGSLPPIKPHL